MPRHANVATLPPPPPDHPAVRACAELGGWRVAAARVEVLKACWKSSVYRVTGPGSPSVIAKRCRRITADIERVILGEILPGLPLAAPRLYGIMDEPDGEYRWLFLEDAAGEAYSPLLESHRQAAGRWLGLLHATAAQSPAASRLPDRGPRHYRKHLHAARDAILRNLANPALGEQDAAALRAVVAHCEELTADWGRVEEFCDGMPRTLVHGDFVAKNLRVRIDGDDIALLVFDWEQAGWGIPAPDLSAGARPDLAAYAEAGPGMDAARVERLVAVGVLFRNLAALAWEADRLAFAWLERPLRNIQTYYSRIASALRALREQG